MVVGIRRHCSIGIEGVVRYVHILRCRGRDLHALLLITDEGGIHYPYADPAGDVEATQGARDVALVPENMLRVCCSVIRNLRADAGRREFNRYIKETDPARGMRRIHAVADRNTRLCLRRRKRISRVPIQNFYCVHCRCR